MLRFAKGPARVANVVKAFEEASLIPLRRISAWDRSNKTKAHIVASQSSRNIARGFAHAATLSAAQRPTITSGVEQAEFSDVVIVGGGVVGLALACSLAASATFRSSGASITLLEASSLDSIRSWSKRKQNDLKIDDWENRAIYLTEENRVWLSSLGIDDFLLQHRLGPVQSMHVTDGLTGAALDFDAPSGSKRGLGTMVEISHLQQALLQRLEAVAKKSNVDVRILDGAKVERIEAVVPQTEASTTQASQATSSYVDAWPLITVQGTDGTSSHRIKARLLVGADGQNSPVRRYAGIQAHGWPYDRMGVVATAKITQEQERTAFQRFLPTGTIAWLPLSHDSASLVWTLPPPVAKAVVSMQRNHEAKGDGSVSPIARLLTASFRLPWDALSPILARIASNASLGVEDDSWIVAALEEAAMLVEPDGDGSAVSVPPTISSVLERSVAAFPLKLSHAEAYIGSALRQTTFAESGAAAILPSTILQTAINGLSTLASVLRSPEAAEQGINDQQEPSFGRTALIGDAAHTIHPLAGQGLNLGIADAHSLGKALIQAASEGADLGSHLSLQPYPRDRYLANQAMLSAVDHLHWLFVVPPPGHVSNSVLGDFASRAIVWGRSTGFEVLNELGFVKQAIVGAAGSSSRK